MKNGKIDSSSEEAIPGVAWDRYIGSRTRLSWERFNRDAKETIGAGLIPFAVLAQCFHRHWGWKVLGALLTIPMALLACATLLVAAGLAAVQTAFYALVRFPSSFVQDLVEQTYSFKEIFEALGYDYEGENLNPEGGPESAISLTHKNAAEDRRETLHAGWVTPFEMLQSFFKEETSTARKCLGVLIALPLLAVNLLTGLFSLVSVAVQFSALPLRLITAKFQDFLSPELGRLGWLGPELSVEGSTEVSELTTNKPLLSEIPYRQRQFEYRRPEKAEAASQPDTKAPTLS